MTAPAVHVSLGAALGMGPPPAGNLAVPVFAHGTLAVELYTPHGEDRQTPHTRDEVYVVARGRGVFFDGTGRHAVEAGSFLFVAAGQPHRFEDFSPDFAVWVFFYGPDGGEAAAVGQAEPDRWTVYRIDDNANVFVVREGVGREEADRLVAEFTARGHKQTYWSEPDRR